MLPASPRSSTSTPSWRPASPIRTSAIDPAELRTVTTRYHELTPVVDAVRRQRAAAADADAARELLEDATGDERELAQAELDDAPRAARRDRRRAGAT